MEFKVLVIRENLGSRMKKIDGRLSLPQIAVAYFNAGCSALASRYVEVKRKALAFHIQDTAKGTRNRVFCCMKKSIFATNIKSKSFYFSCDEG
jgi:hypothetical protein